MWSYGGGSIPSVIQGAEQWHGDDPRQPVGGSTAGSASTGHLRRSRQVHGKASNSIRLKYCFAFHLKNLLKNRCLLPDFDFPFDKTAF